MSLLLAPLAALGAGDDGPIVGAIRWDGWYGDGTVTKAVEASLGQLKYHFRLPWFAQVQRDGSVRNNGGSQAIMAQELACAAAARLNYWAVVDYSDEAPGMSVALNRYLAAKDKRGIRYCPDQDAKNMTALEFDAEFGYKSVENRVSVPDLHATILHQLGLDHTRLNFTHNGRPERITDSEVTGAHVVNEVLA